MCVVTHSQSPHTFHFPSRMQTFLLFLRHILMRVGDAMWPPLWPFQSTPHASTGFALPQGYPNKMKHNLYCVSEQGNPPERAQNHKSYHGDEERYQPRQHSSDHGAVASGVHPVDDSHVIFSPCTRAPRASSPLELVWSTTRKRPKPAVIISQNNVAF